MEAIQTAHHAQAVIDGGGSRFGFTIELAADIVEQARLLELGQRTARRLQPASEMQQVISVRAQGARRELAKPLSIEEIVGPGDFPIVLVEEPIRGGAGGRSLLHNQSQGHRD
jgi:hypothetical protein